MQRKIRMGMVGGGEGAFIGAVHRMAAALDGQIELVCGAFSGDPARARRSGAALYLPAARVYADYHAMFAAEARLAPEQRMDFAAIVTPNHLHFPVALAAIEHGFHVFSEKPATLSLDECLRLRAALRGRDLLYALAYTYTGYPLVREARARIARGELGEIRKVVVDYSQGWLALPEERTGNRQAQWRLDPQRAGASACIGDIGAHAANLAEYVTGLNIVGVCAELNTFVPGRELDDDGAMLLRFDNGARGILHASQICSGEENDLSIRVYGEKGGLRWSQEEPNSLWLLQHDRPRQVLRAGGPQLSGAARAACRTPAGHPEGYLEAFANLYRDFAAALRGAPVPPAVPDIDAAVRGMAFIETVVASHASQQKWTPFFPVDGKPV
jgi:predicted dehydrogenase